VNDVVDVPVSTAAR